MKAAKNCASRTPELMNAIVFALQALELEEPRFSLIVAPYEANAQIGFLYATWPGCIALSVDLRSRPPLGPMFQIIALDS